MKKAFILLILLTFAACHPNKASLNSNEKINSDNTLSQQSVKNSVARCLRHKLKFSNLPQKDLAEFMGVMGKASSECRAKRKDIEEFLKTVNTFP